MRNPDRTSYDPTVSPIEGLLTDPSKHTTAGSSDTVYDLARAAIDSATEVDLPDLSLGDPVITTLPADSAHNNGRNHDISGAIPTLQRERLRHIDTALRPPVGIGPIALDPAVAGKIHELNGQISELEQSIQAMQDEYDRSIASHIGPRTQWQSTRQSNIAGRKAMVEERKREVKKLEDSSRPVSDPFTRAKLQQERERLEGTHLPTGREAAMWELKYLSINPLASPRQIADAWRAFRRVRAERGSTGKQTRKQDRARLRRGEEPIHGNGTERPIMDRLKKSKIEKDDIKSQETSYNQIARTGQVIIIDSDWDPVTDPDRKNEQNIEYAMVMDVSPQGAVFTEPDGSTSELYFLDNGGNILGHVHMDQSKNLLLGGPGTSPIIGTLDLSKPDPSAPGGFRTKKVDLSLKEVKENIHQGEEWVTLAQLQDPDDAYGMLLDGVEAHEVSPLRVRLDDLIFGMPGTGYKPRVVTGKGRDRKLPNRLEVLKTHLMWQSTKPGAVVAPDGRVPIFNGHDGHFVRPLTYPEHRRETYTSQIEDARTQAANSARRQDRAPKDSVSDPDKPFYRGPQRRRKWHG